jgi:hypothetical protein
MRAVATMIGLDFQKIGTLSAEYVYIWVHYTVQPALIITSRQFVFNTSSLHTWVGIYIKSCKGF